MIRVVKIGGNVIDDPVLLGRFVQEFAALEGPKVLIHGGGALASGMQRQLGMEPQLVQGRRVTDADTLRIVTMVYAGWCNKLIVSHLQAAGCNAAGFCGADGDLIRCHRRAPLNGVDYGFVGDVDAVNATLLLQLLAAGVTPVLCAITHDGAGGLLNTNADTIASSVAVALAKEQACTLCYCFEKDGVLGADGAVIPALSRADFASLQAAGTVSAGMIPKLETAFRAREAGVEAVRICHATHLNDTIGTILL